MVGDFRPSKGGGLRQPLPTPKATLKPGVHAVYGDVWIPRIEGNQRIPPSPHVNCAHRPLVLQDARKDVQAVPL